MRRVYFTPRWAQGTFGFRLTGDHGSPPNVAKVNGVTFDGKSVSLATGDRLQSLEPESGRTGRANDMVAEGPRRQVLLGRPTRRASRQRRSR
jgi:hypothetical protein